MSPSEKAGASLRESADRCRLMNAPLQLTLYWAPTYPVLRHRYSCLSLLGIVKVVDRQLERLGSTVPGKNLAPYLYLQGPDEDCQKERCWYYRQHNEALGLRSH